MSYITLGETCAPAAALRNLNLRNYALPFDWIRSSANQLCEVISSDFKGFHDNLRLSESRNTVYDSFNLEFPHDYPTLKQPIANINEEDENGGIHEDAIIESWEDTIPQVKEKYRRRIERFQLIMKSEEPVIALFFGKISNIQLFKNIFEIKYNKVNIWYAVLSEEIITDEEKERLLDKEHISVCDPEEVLIDENDNMFIDKFAQAKLWYDAINKIHLKI